MNAPVRRGACPGLSAPMPTGDGLLVRILPNEQIAPDAFIALCDAAREHGNGIIEVTARGSLQVRGLTPRTAPLFAKHVAALNIAETARVPVVSAPLPNDPDGLIDADALAAEIRAAIEGAGLSLSPKVSVTVDGGGRLHLDALTADIRLLAYRATRAPLLGISLGGDARSAIPLGAIAPDAAADVVVRLLGVVAARGPTSRAADVLHNEGTTPLAAAVKGRIQPAPASAPRAASEPIGLHPLRAGVALGLAPAFGQADADVLAELVRIAVDHGAHAVRTAPGRAVLLNGLDQDRAAALASAAARLGFVVRPDDPRRRVAACPGRPACSSGFIAARALAGELAQRLPPGSGDIDIHVSGCAKGCAHPAPAALTVVGSDHGCGIIRRGSARATPQRYVDEKNLVAEIRHV